MNQQWMHAVAVALSLGMTSPALAGQAAPKSNDAAVLLQAAMHTEQVEGRLPEAIDAYKNVVARAGANKAVAAQALLRLGAAYERLGRPEAREAYERVVRNYPDRPKEAAAAKARLAKVGGGAVVKKAQVDIIPRKVLEGHESQLTDITPDGRIAVGRARRSYGSFDVIQRDVSSGKVTVLVPGETGSYPFQPRISDDGRHVAYEWTDDTFQKSALKVVGTEPDARARTLFSQPLADVMAADWSPDGTSVLATVIRYASRAESDARTPEALELTTIDVASGALRVLARFEGWHERGSLFQARFSPDGRHVAHMRQPSRNSRDRYVEVIDLAGGATTIVGTAADRRQPRWSADGSTLFYLEGSYDRTSLWSVPVQVGRAAGTPTQLQTDITGFLLGATQAGSLAWAKSVEGGNFVFLSDRRPATGAALEVLEGFGGRWSPDGQRIVFARNRGDGVDLIVRDAQTGQEISHRFEGLTAAPPIWLPDGSGLIAHASAGSNIEFLKLTLANGAFAKLFLRNTPTRNRSFGALAPDGRTMYLARADESGGALDDIVAVDLATGQERVVADLEGAPGRSVSVALAVSPDGRTLAVMAYAVAYESARIFTIGVDGNERRDVVPSVGAGWVGNSNLQWSRDGQSLIFLAFDERKNWRIMRVPAEGGLPEPDGVDFDTVQSLLQGRRLFPGNFNGFSVSPDGTRVATSAMTMYKDEVWALDVAALMAAK